MNIFSKMAFRSMKQNRVRTVVTIVGIILSTAMFTAVTTSVSSYSNYFSKYMEYRHGSWSYALYNVSQEEVNSYYKDDTIESFAYLQNEGFAIAKESKNQYKPYFCIEGMGQDTLELLPIRLTEGRLPQDSTEVVISNHAISNGGMKLRVGQTLTLDVGKRMYAEEELDNHVGYWGEDDKSDSADEQDTEYLTDLTAKTYTVVGFCERPSFEDFSAPGYTVFTVAEPLSKDADAAYDVYIKLVREQDTAERFRKESDRYSGIMNYDYLRTKGNSGEVNFNATLYGLAAILIGIIVFGSIALIYNSFSISVNERMKFFGILSSVGATRKQLTKSVLTEAVFLGCVGIPFGIMAGILGMMITFYFVGEKLAQFVFATYPIPFSLHPSFAAILFAVVLAMVTILISAYIPIHKAMKTSVIDIIRQSREIKIKGRQVKTARLTQKLFGFEGMLASKNFKRNRRKYRATIASLFVSIVLFISASSFCAYLEKSVSTVYENYGFEVLLYEQRDLTDEFLVSDVLDEISAMSEVDSVSNTITLMTQLVVQTAGMEEEAVNYYCPTEVYNNVSEIPIRVSLVFLEDELFCDFARTQHVDADDYFDKDHFRALIYDSLEYYDDRYYSCWTIASLQKAKPTIALVRKTENEFNGLQAGGDGKVYAEFLDQDTDTFLTVPIEEAADTIAVEGELVRTLPEKIYVEQKGYQILLLYPQSQLSGFLTGYDGEYANFSQMNGRINYSICTNDDKAVVDKLKELESGLTKPPLHFYISNFKESADEERTIIFVVNVFSYGFIILISLIALTNVFNTISTNIQLRSREFAMLRSIGMSPAKMKRMMNYECLLYGIKGIMYGLPVSVFVTYLIWRVTANGVWMPFFIPWYSIVISVGSVFLVVFATMLYAMHRISQENPMDALKEEI